MHASRKRYEKRYEGKDGITQGGERHHAKGKNGIMQRRKGFYPGRRVLHDQLTIGSDKG